MSADFSILKFQITRPTSLLFSIPSSKLFNGIEEVVAKQSASERSLSDFLIGVNYDFIGAKGPLAYNHEAVVSDYLASFSQTRDLFGRLENKITKKESDDEGDSDSDDRHRRTASQISQISLQYDISRRDTDRACALLVYTDTSLRNELIHFYQVLINQRKSKPNIFTCFLF